MTKGQKIIIFVGSFLITFITICAFFRDDIKYMLVSRVIDRKYGNTTENIYFLEDNFAFVDNHDDVEVSSREDIINSIYYIINSGATYSERYCAKEYTNCIKDIESIGSDQSLLSVLNNFVHPYNSFKKITFSYDDDSIGISVEHTYSDEEIEEINSVVDKFVDENITNNMSTRDKIKVIHDYIIDNTDYDNSFVVRSNDNKYKSNTAYAVLMQGYGICSGYSDAMAIFLNKLNIINYKITTDESNITDTSDGHIWNLVYIDGKWLHLDLTWDDPVSERNITRDNYFLINTETLKLLDKDKNVQDAHSFDTNIFSEAK